MKTKTTLLLLLLLVQVEVQAGFYTGNDMLANLQKSGNDKAAAVGYIMGVADSMAYARWLGGVPKDLACFDIPDKVTGTQVGDTVRIWLEKNPQARHGGGHAIVGLALTEAFPCSARR